MLYGGIVLCINTFLHLQCDAAGKYLACSARRRAVNVCARLDIQQINSLCFRLCLILFVWLVRPGMRRESKIQKIIVRLGEFSFIVTQSRRSAATSSLLLLSCSLQLSRLFGHCYGQQCYSRRLALTYITPQTM